MGVSATPDFTAILAATLITGYQVLCATFFSTVHNWHLGSTIDWGREHKMGSVHHRVRRDGRRDQHGTSHVSVPVSGNGTRLFLFSSSFFFPQSLSFHISTQLAFTGDIMCLWV